MALPTSLTVNVAELLRRPATRKAVRAELAAHDLRVVDTWIPDGTPIDVDLELESLTDGITVTGTIATRWEGLCRRCLEAVGGVLEVTVRELFQRRPSSEDAFAFEGEQIDLTPLVREAAMLDLPLAPVCRPDCAGLCPTCGANRNETDCGHRDAPVDAHWSALDELRERLDRPES